MKTTALFLVILLCQMGSAQSIPAPEILEVKEDDRMATIYWNSKTDSYDPNYDPWKNQGISSYVVEWGKVSEGFTQTMYTPFRVIQCQPLVPGVMYQARIYSLDNYGIKSAASSTVQFQHDGNKVASMRNRLNGFFDDFNLPMGAFDELKWNQSYTGCSQLGYLSQHINNQFHAHNVLASGPCDRGAASSRPRTVFDFTNRTGIIEYDLDGSRHGGQRWFLFLIPADRKRDLSGHASLPIPVAADPPFLLRISKSSVEIANADGEVVSLPNMYNDNTCGPDPSLVYCSDENLESIPNVRRHFRIEISKTHIKIFTNDILILDGSLITDITPNGLPYEVAQVNWIFHSYDTKKRNLPIAMIHWDNFGFDAPAGWQPSEVIHNYTDGHLGSNVAGTVHHASNGMLTSIANPAQSEIPIPDSITDQNGNMPLKAELMFTLQSGAYQWNSTDFIRINNQSYPFEQPVSNIGNLSSDGLVGSTVPYSAIVSVNPTDLLTGNNIIQYHLTNAKILNVHIELTYPIGSAPSFTQPNEIHDNYRDKLMAFNTYTKIGPNLTIPQVNGFSTWMPELFPVDYDETNDYRMLAMQPMVSGVLQFDVFANSNAQLASKGVATGISHYKVFVDQQVVQTIYTNAHTPVTHFQHYNLSFDTRLLSNGTHYLYVEAYDVYNRPSVFDLFLASVRHGEYFPIAFTVNNTESIACVPNLSNADLTDQNNEIALGSYFASNSIETNGEVALGSTVSLHASNRITLNSGFKVAQGGNIVVRTQACPF